MDSSGRKRRAIWVSTSLSTHGGIATYVRNMEQTPLWINWNITHIATHCDGSKAAKVRIFSRAVQRFLREVLTDRPAIVHIHTSSNGSFVRKAIISWFCFALRVPAIIHVHGSRFHEFYEHSSRLLQAIIRSTLERSSTVIALGDTWAARLQQIAPRASIMTVPNSIQARKTVNQNIDGPVHVTFLGEVCDRKGTFLLLEAWGTLISSEGIHAKLTVAGNGEVDRARQLIKNLGISDTVNVTGWLAPDDVETLLDRSHILVLPSFNEGQPMAILEAMARGLCVVASTSGGIPEMLAGDSGMLVEPLNRDTLREFLTLAMASADLRRRLGGNALARTREVFSVDETCRRLDSLYSRLAGTR